MPSSLLKFLCGSLLLMLTLPASAEEKEMPLRTATYSFYLDEKGAEVLHGPAVKKFADGHKQSEGTWKHGKRDGLWTTWYASGIKAMEESYDADNLDGMRKLWLLSGQQILQEFYNQGQREGEYQEWHENGALKTKGIYLHGVLDGLLRQWHANGKKSLELNYSNGRRNGNLLSWNENGEECPTRLFRDDKELQSRIKLDKYPNGQPREAYAYFIDEHGREVKHGKYDKWFPNGEPWIHTAYYFGQLHGEYHYGKKDGLDYRLETYDHGVKHGRFVWFHDGHQTREEFWDKGVMVHERNS